MTTTVIWTTAFWAATKIFPIRQESCFPHIRLASTALFETKSSGLVFLKP
jgi:hypothetical protein